MRLNLLYFARVREVIGVSAETLDLSENLSDEPATVADVLNVLRTRGERYETAFSDTGALRFALDHEFVSMDAHVGEGSELGVFPPVTGG